MAGEDDAQRRGVDRGVFHGQARAVSVREALIWSAIGVTLGLAFAAFVYFWHKHRWIGLGTALAGKVRSTSDRLIP